jgi:soluble lytic murein transglycosylase
VRRARLTVLLGLLLAGTTAVADAPPSATSTAGALAALAAAQAALESGDLAGAQRRAEPLADAPILIRDHALRLAAEAAQRRGDHVAALRLAERLAGQRGSRLAGQARWMAADALFALGRVEEAGRAYEQLLRGGPPGDRALALARIAAAHDHARRLAAAQATWRRLVIEHASHPAAATARTRLRATGAPSLTPAETITQARALIGRRRWNEALVALESLKAGLSEELAVRRDFWIAQALYHARRQYERAGRLFLAVSPKVGRDGPEALFKGARALSRADRDDEARTRYREVVARYPRTTWADEAQFLLGGLELNRGRPAAALPDLLRHRQRYPRSPFGAEARWCLGLAHHLLGNEDAALSALAGLPESGDQLTGGKGAYWHAEILEHLGRTDEATAELRRLVNRFPLSWYALLAHGRLKERGIAVHPFGAGPRRGGPTLPAPDSRLAATPAISRVDQLLAAGLSAAAIDELRSLERPFLKRYGQRAVGLLIDRYRKAGDWHGPWRLAVSRGGAALSQPPEGASRAWWEHAYPQAYRPLVERHRDRLSPFWVYAIMLKESGFDPYEVSYANATGLMQLIPETARRAAKALGLEYREELLKDPATNIRVAAWYLGKLFQMTKGQLPLAAAAFNGGPGAMRRYLARSGASAVDEFVERIPAKQSREYAKKVTAIYARYLYLYEKKVYEQPLTVDRDFGKEVEY